MTQTTVHLLRHGEVENPEDVLYERLPGFHLSKRGVRMANAAAEYISSTPDLSKIQHIYSSPLERAVETAKPVATALGGVPIINDTRLLESEHKLAGKNIHQEYKNMLSRGQLIRLAQIFGNPTRPSWGEAYRDIYKRMHSIISEVVDQFAGEEILLVSHQAPIWIARLGSQEKPLRHNPLKRECSLASITSITFNNEAQEFVELQYREPAADVV
jgi:broad specificity phosphatase PhoE